MGSVEFHGETFRLADSIALMALMRFAKVAQAGTDSDDMAGLVAMYDLLEQCIHPEDWPRFEVLATRERDQADDLLAVIQQAITEMAERPTAPPSDSSDGRPSTSGNSTGDSSSLGVHLLERPGNAHLAYAARQQELRAV
jgi:hypothetical protein